MKFTDVKRNTDRCNYDFEGSWTAPSTIVVTATLKDEFKDWTNEWQDKVECGEALLNVSTHSLYVSRIDAKPRGQGYGSELLSEIIAAARVHSMTKIVAYVENNNAESKNLFRKAGFKEVSGNDGGYWTLPLVDEINEGGEAVMPISIFKVIISPHLEQQRKLPERNVSWNEIYRILKRLSRIKQKLKQMIEFKSFYIRDNETGTEIGCKLTENNPVRADDDKRLDYVLYCNTVVRKIEPRRNAEAPIIEV